MKQLALYCFIGGVGVSSDFVVFYLINSAGTSYQLANIAGYGFGAIISFSLNRIFTFKAKDKPVTRLAIFCAVATIGYSVSAAMLWMLVEGLILESNLAKIITLPVVVALQFILNKLITFRAVEAAN